MCDDEKKIINLMNYDPIKEAEEFVGERDSRKSDGLGFLLNKGKGEMMRELAEKNNDSHLGITIWDFKDIITKIGFEKVLSIDFISKFDGAKELYHIYYNKEGIILSFDSCGRNLNGGNCYFNWKPNDFQKAYSLMLELHINGGWLDYKDENTLWIGQFDLRDNLKLRLEIIRRNGTFINPWIKRPFLWLLHYMDTKEENYNYGEINEERIKMLPEEVQNTIGKEL